MNSDDLEPPVKEYRPAPLGGLTFDPPTPFPPLRSLRFDTYTHVALLYLALALSLVSFLEAVLRYLSFFLMRFACVKKRGQGGDAGKETIDI